MKRFVVSFGLALALVAPGMTAQASGGPDWQMRCKNGKQAKVWLSPFKVENKCDHDSKQWVELVFHDTDEDTWIINVAAETKYKKGQIDYPGLQVYAGLGRGVFCAEKADKNYADLTSVLTVYNEDRKWRAECNPYDSRNKWIVGDDD